MVFSFGSDWEGHLKLCNAYYLFFKWTPYKIPND